MKLFNRLPSFLKVILLSAFVAVCIAINAIALTEIADSLKNRTAVSTPVAESTTPQTASSSEPASTSQTTAVTTEQSQQQLSQPNDENTEAPDEALRESPNSEVANLEPADAEPKYGHLPYSEAPAEEMVLIGSYAEAEIQREETLHPEAAKALFEMIAAARADGLWIVPASGFRTFAQQRTLFNAQIIRRGTPEAAATVSAPPGYSEHHTGYAIDLIDGALPQSQDISETFAETPAYDWLLANAETYGFALSFPADNNQGISFEPWHWRYVGTPAAQSVFGLAPSSLDTRNATSDIVE